MQLEDKDGKTPLRVAASKRPQLYIVSCKIYVYASACMAFKTTVDRMVQL
jgi:hypothetical protein